MSTRTSARFGGPVLLVLASAALLAGGLAPAADAGAPNTSPKASQAEPDEAAFLAELGGRLDAVAHRPGASPELLQTVARRTAARYAHARRETALTGGEVAPGPGQDPRADERRQRAAQKRIERRLLALALRASKSREEWMVQRDGEDRQERQRAKTRPPARAILSATGGISGNVSAPSGPVQWVELDLYDSSGSYLTYAYTDGSGNYAFSGLASGSYYVRTWNWDGLIDEAWNDVPCLGLSPKDCGGAPVSVTDGATTPGIDFVLAAGGRVSGTVRASATGNGIESVGVELYNSSGVWVTNGWTVSDGSYLTAAGVPAGTYFVRTSARQLGYINEAYDGIRCAPCDVTTTAPVTVTVPNTTPNIDFALDLGGTISGHVTDSVTSLPVAGVRVYAYDSTGGYLVNATAAADGSYSIGGFTTGSYRLRTYNSLGYINEVYDNHACPGSCIVTTGDAVAVTEGATRTGIDFALDPGASVSGTVTDTGTSLPLAGVEVALFLATGSWAGSATSAADGTYTVGGLVAATYYARTSNSSGYLHELYREHPCPGYCILTDGDPIVVGPGADVTGIDFTLAQGARISGHVTSTTGTPLAGVPVNVYTQDGYQLDDAVTDGSGAYSIGGLTTGSYIAATSAGGDYVDEIHADVPCPECSDQPYFLYWPTLATPIAVTEGSTSTVDFALTVGGSIGGSLTSTSLAGPIEAEVELYDRTGGYLRSAIAAGSYSFPGLPAGVYYVAAYGQHGEIAEIYDDLSQPGVSVLRGSPVTVAAGAATSGIDFALSPGARIAGRVTVAATGAPVEDAEVDVYGASGKYVTWGYTDAAGGYETVGGLPTGRYFAYVYPPWSSDLPRQLYKGIDCLSLWVECPIASGDPIDVTAPVTKTGVDFALAAGGSVAGTVTEAGTGLGIAGVYVYVYAVSGTGSTTSRGATTSSSGSYTVSGLPAGGYYVVAQGGDYVRELYDNVPCLSCTLTTGQKVHVGAGAATSGVNFALARGGAVRGSVTSGAAGFGVSAQVRLYDGSGAQLGWTWTDAAGAYAFRGLPAATYYVKTIAALGHLDELYDNLPCTYSTCDPVTGTGVGVSAGSTASGVDFVLASGGTITGFVRDAGGMGAANGGVTVYGTSGQGVGWSYVAPNGFYQVASLAAGDHYVVATGLGGLVSEVYDDVPCVGCSPAASGTPVPVSAGGTTSGIDFALAAGGAFSGTVTDAAGAPAVASIQAYNAAGGYVGGVSSDDTGYYRTSVGLPPGTYFATAGASGTEKQLYDGLACASCDPTTGTPIAVSGSGTTTGIDFGLRRAPRQFFTLRPCRAVDTRRPVDALGGPALGAKVGRNFGIAGTCGIPLDAKAVSVNVTSTASTAAGHLRLHAGRTAIPAASALNYALGQTRANNAIVPVNDVGEIAVYCGQPTGATHVIVDVNGYFK